VVALVLWLGLLGIPMSLADTGIPTDLDADGIPNGQDPDADGDGYDGLEWGGTDCDDYDRFTNPGAIEHWYDGIDSNCDGLDDFDQDGDGFTGTRLGVGAEDCNDLDSGIHPDAEEDLTEVDRNCDGIRDPVHDLGPRGGCACGPAAPSPGWTVGWLAVGLVWRRRRQR